jgi:hypothetical protein
VALGCQPRWTGSACTREEKNPSLVVPFQGQLSSGSGPKETCTTREREGENSKMFSNPKDDIVNFNVFFLLQIMLLYRKVLIPFLLFF